MVRRQPCPHLRLPRLWLMTDARMGDALWPALERLPRGAGVVFRHYDHPDRRTLYERVQRVARRRGLVLVLAGPMRMAIGWRADGVHGAGRSVRPPRPLLHTASAHDARELRRAELAGADIIFLSPVLATRSHPGDRALGPVRFGLLARQSKANIIALGGMDARGARRLRALGATGWAGIDAWLDGDSF